MFKRKLTRREHKSRRVKGEPQIELNVCWKWYIYPGRRQILEQVLKQAQQQLEEILCVPQGTIQTAEVREIEQTKDRILSKLGIVMANRIIAVDVQLPEFNNMLDGVIHRTQTDLLERINCLEEKLETQHKALERMLQSQRQELLREVMSQREEYNAQRQELEGELLIQREEYNAQRQEYDVQRVQTESELMDLKNRVKVHDEARDKLFCGQLAYEIDKLARKVVYGDAKASKLTFHELLEDQPANTRLQVLCNDFEALGLSIKTDVEPCLRSLKDGRVLHGHPKIETFPLQGRSVEDVLTERYPRDAAVMVDIIRAVQNKFSQSYTPLASLNLSTASR